MRLFGSRFDAGDTGAAPGTVLGLDDAGERLRVAVEGGAIALQKLLKFQNITQLVKARALVGMHHQDKLLPDSTLSQV